MQYNLQVESLNHFQAHLASRSNKELFRKTFLVGPAKELVMSATPDIQQKVFMRQCQYLFAVAMILGVSPVGINKDGTLNTTLCSFQAIYSALLFLTTSVILLFRLYILSVNVKQLDLVFDDYVILVCLFAIKALHFLPVLSFIAKNQILRLNKSWNDLEQSYISIINKPLPVSVKKPTIFCLVTLVLVSVFNSFTTYSIRRNGQNHLDQLIHQVDITSFYLFQVLMMYYFLIGGLQCIIWYILTLSIRQVADHVLKEFKASVLSSRDVADFQKLWMALREATLATTRAGSTTLLYFVLFMFCMMMVSFYTVFYMVGSGQLLAFLFLPFMTTSAFSSIGECGYKVKREVCSNFESYLLERVMVEKRPAVRQQLQWFLHVVSTYPPCISLNGFLTLNREFNVAVLGTLFSTMVIIIQFKSNTKEGN